MKTINGLAYTIAIILIGLGAMSIQNSTHIAGIYILTALFIVVYVIYRNYEDKRLESELDRNRISSEVVNEMIDKQRLLQDENKRLILALDEVSNKHNIIGIPLEEPTYTTEYIPFSEENDTTEELHICCDKEMRETKCFHICDVCKKRIRKVVK